VIRYAVIPTRGNRMDELRRCAEAIASQVSGIVVIDNTDDGSVWDVGLNGFRWPDTHIIHDPEQPPNLSRLWNLGIDYCRQRADGVGQWEVAVLNDDVIVPPYWFAELGTQMRSASCAAAGYGPRLAVHRTPGTTDLMDRLPGFAFILAGETGIRADEDLRWWCGDNDLDMQARAISGTLIWPGEVVHLYPDLSTYFNPVLQAQTGLDMDRFVKKWGFRPWVI